MKRDMDLIRLILLDVEGETNVDLGSYSDQKIRYHNWLLLDAGLVEGMNDRGMNDKYNSALITGLNWEGHDFLDASRDEATWNKAQKTIGENVGTVAFDMLKALLISLTKDQLGLT